MIQMNINLYMFRAEFLVKKHIFDERWVFNFFSRKSVGQERGRNGLLELSSGYI